MWSYRQTQIPQRKERAQVASREVIQLEPQVRALRDMAACSREITVWSYSE